MTSAAVAAVVGLALLCWRRWPPKTAGCLCEVVVRRVAGGYFLRMPPANNSNHRGDGGSLRVVVQWGVSTGVAVRRRRRGPLPGALFHPLAVLDVRPRVSYACVCISKRKNS